MSNDYPITDSLPMEDIITADDSYYEPNPLPPATPEIDWDAMTSQNESTAAIPFSKESEEDFGSSPGNYFIVVNIAAAAPVMPVLPFPTSIYRYAPSLKEAEAVMSLIAIELKRARKDIQKDENPRLRVLSVSVHGPYNSDHGDSDEVCSSIYSGQQSKRRTLSFVNLSSWTPDQSGKLGPPPIGKVVTPQMFKNNPSFLERFPNHKIPDKLSNMLDRMYDEGDYPLTVPIPATPPKRPYPVLPERNGRGDKQWQRILTNHHRAVAAWQKEVQSNPLSEKSMEPNDPRQEKGKQIMEEAMLFSKSVFNI